MRLLGISGSLQAGSANTALLEVVRSVAGAGVDVVVSAAPSPERGVHARADLERTLQAQGARVLASATIAVPTNLRGHEVDDPQIRASMVMLLQAVVDHR